MEYTKGFLFDHALLIGMTADEYWYGDPSLLYNYENAFVLKQKYDLQMAWTYGAYFKSALGSTQLWTVQPYKRQDWKQMPKYAEYPVKQDDYIPKKPITDEKKELIEKARAKLTAMGLLARDE